MVQRKRFSLLADIGLFSQSPLIKVGEILLIAAVIFHGLNGLRLILHAFGIGVRQQKKLFPFVMLATILGSVLFVFRLFGE